MARCISSTPSWRQPHGRMSISWFMLCLLGIFQWSPGLDLGGGGGLALGMCKGPKLTLKLVNYGLELNKKDSAIEMLERKLRAMEKKKNEVQKELKKTKTSENNYKTDLKKGEVGNAILNTKG